MGTSLSSYIQVPPPPGQGAISYAGVKIWNDIPPEIRRQSQLLFQKVVQRTFDDGTHCLISASVNADIEKYQYQPIFTI